MRVVCAPQRSRYDLAAVSRHASTLQQEREEHEAEQAQRLQLRMEAVTAEIKAMSVGQLAARARELCIPTAQWQAARDGMDPKVRH